MSSPSTACPWCWSPATTWPARTRAGYAPQARTVAVKDYVSRYAAVCRTPARTAADIRAAAAEAAALAGAARTGDRRAVHRGAGVRRRAPGRGRDRRARRAADRGAARRVHQQRRCTRASAPSRRSRRSSRPRWRSSMADVNDRSDRRTGARRGGALHLRADPYRHHQPGRRATAGSGPAAEYVAELLAERRHRADAAGAHPGPDQRGRPDRGHRPVGGRAAGPRPSGRRARGARRLERAPLLRGDPATGSSGAAAPST